LKTEYGKKGTSHMAERLEYKDYPETPNIRSGGKVGWRYYDRLRDAEECSEAARFNAKVQEGLGYDFGYCSPGSVWQIPEDADSPFAGKWEVCIP
jgi:hypothetical protein